MQPPASLQVSTPNDLEIVMTRTFNAPRTLVWDAMIKPEMLKRWMFTPPQWSWAECEMDVRVGGEFRWAWNGPDGQLALLIWGVYKELDAPFRIVHTERMEMGPGAVTCGPENAECAEEPWELLATLELNEQGGKTEMRMTLSFGSKAARDGALASGMEHGMEAGYAALDAFLAEGGR